MNPQGFSLLYLRKNRSDYRAPTRSEDEMPLHFMVSNRTYRIILAGERILEKYGILERIAQWRADLQRSNP